MERQNMVDYTSICTMTSDFASRFSRAITADRRLGLEKAVTSNAAGYATARRADYPLERTDDVCPLWPFSYLPRQTEGHSLRKTWLRLRIHPGLGEGTFAGYHCKAIRCESGYRKLTADIEFANRKVDGPTIKVRQNLGVKG